MLISLKKNKFDDELSNLNKNVTSNKTKHVLFQNFKLFNQKNVKSEEVKPLSTKGLAKDLINKISILKDILPVFNNFRKKQQKCRMQCFFVCKSMYILKLHSIKL